MDDPCNLVRLHSQSPSSSTRKHKIRLSATSLGLLRVQMRIPHAQRDVLDAPLPQQNVFVALQINHLRPPISLRPVPVRRPVDFCLSMPLRPCQQASMCRTYSTTGLGNACSFGNSTFAYCVWLETCRTCMPCLTDRRCSRSDTWWKRGFEGLKGARFVSPCLT